MQCYVSLWLYVWRGACARVGTQVYFDREKLLTYLLRMRKRNGRGL